MWADFFKVMLDRGQSTLESPGHPIKKLNSQLHAYQPRSLNTSLNVEMLVQTWAVWLVTFEIIRNGQVVECCVGENDDKLLLSLLRSLLRRTRTCCSRRCLSSSLSWLCSSSFLSFSSCSWWCFMACSSCWSWETAVLLLNMLAILDIDFDLSCLTWTHFWCDNHSMFESLKMF